MREVKLMIKGGMFTLALLLVVMLTVVIMSELGQLALAQNRNQPAITTPDVEVVEYVWPTETAPQRDITVQRFAPLEVSQ